MPLMRGPDGSVVEVATEDAQHALDTGYTPVSTAEAAPEITARENDQGGALGGVSAGLTSLASGATLGLSDLALKGLLTQDQMRDVADARAAHPYISTGGSIIGAVAPALIGDEAGLAGLASKTPAGFVTDIGSRVAERFGGGALGTAAAGALEGGAMNAGSYVSEVALGNRDLSAEGFLGAMGKGALYGGVSAGALSLASNGAIAARRLLPAFEVTPEAVADAQTAATQALRDSVDTSTRLSKKAQDAIVDTNRETQQFLQDLEAERAKALAETPQDVANENGAPAAQPEQPTAQPETAVPTEAPQPAPEAANTEAPSSTGGEPETPQPMPESGGETPDTQPTDTTQPEQPEAPQPEQPTAKPKKPVKAVATKTAKQLLKDWRAKYGAGVVDYDAANAAARRGRLSEWAKNFVPKNAEDETIKAYFESPQDPMRTNERVGGTDVPEGVKVVATNAASEASHAAYHEALAQATNVSKSGTELMARSIYAARKAAAQAMDDVYAAYRAGAPIADIRNAAAQRLTNQLHELADARADMIKSLASKPEAAQAIAEQVGGAPQGQSLGEKILSGTAPAKADPDEVISKALDKSKDVNEDIAELAPKITRYEAAKAQLTESLGEKASPDAVAHAQAFRQAQQSAEAATAQNTAETAESIDKLQRGVPAQKVAGGGRSLLKTANKLGTGYELLRDLGVPLPDPKSVPVIGPLLSLYLKAKVWSRLLRGKGGLIAETAEGTIAAKAAQTRQRIVSAVDTMLGGTAKVTAKAAELAGPMALSHKLFDDGKKQPYSSQPKGGSLEDNYQARLAELTAALKPGAIDDAVKSRIHTSDPSITNAIIAAETQKAQYLYDTAPKPDGPPMPGQPQRLPSKAEIEDWSHVVAAAHDPAAVFEKVAAGGRARPSEIDCVNNCFPNLMAEAQKRFVEKIAKLDKPLPYTRRVAVSMLTGIPLDSTMTPDHAAFLQQGFSTPAAMPTPPMPHSTLSGDIRLGQQTLTRLDK